jgi:hypothetical protein
MRQEGGIGSRVTWKDPEEYVEALTGFKRYFTIENEITKILFDLANDTPKEWDKYKDPIVRRERVQTIVGSTRTALFAAAFQLQAACMRAALNHEIQSTGAILTKRLQRLIWDLQPIGVHPWEVAPMNIHDEIMCPTRTSGEVEKVVGTFLQTYKPLIPLIKMSWKSMLENWSEK